MYKLTIRLYQKPTLPRRRRRRSVLAVYYAYFYDEQNTTQIGDFYTNAVPPTPTAIINWDYTFEYYDD